MTGKSALKGDTSNVSIRPQNKYQKFPVLFDDSGMLSFII